MAYRKTEKLQDLQDAHVARIRKILHQASGYVDTTSDICVCKRITACCLAKQLNLPLLVVCRIYEAAAWEALCFQEQIPVMEIITYDKLRGGADALPNHTLLVREKVGEEIIYHPSTAYKEAVDSGLLLILDDTYNARFRAFKACAALTTPIHSSQGPSRLGLLGRFSDRKWHEYSLLFLLGYIDEEIARSGFGVASVQDLINKCAKIDALQTEKIVNREHNSRKLMSELFHRVVLPKMSSDMDKA